MSIAHNLSEVRASIEGACARAGRRSEDVTLIAVSKTKPVLAVDEALKAGQQVFGENRVQELREKYVALEGAPVSWHLIGTLQSNKVKYLNEMERLALIHSVDNEKLAMEIERQGEKCGRIFDVLLEVNMAHEDTKAGLSPEEAVDFLKRIAPLLHLNVKGLMTIAPFTEDAESNRRYFAGLHELMETMNAKKILPEEMHILSMGMSGDYTVAIEEGATHVRVGTAIFGERR